MVSLLPLSLLCCIFLVLPLGRRGTIWSGRPSGKGHKVQFQRLPFGEQLVESFDLHGRGHPVFGVLDFLVAVRELPLAVLLSLPAAPRCVRLGVVLVSFSVPGIRVFT